MITMIDALTGATVLVALAAGSQGSGREPFDAHTVTLTGTIVLAAPVDEVFELFSPLGEKKWVEGWNPQILFPKGGTWNQGMVFRTFSPGQEATWIVAELDLHAHRVVYYRVEPARLVARVEVRCRALAADRTEATIVYSYVGLTQAGNDHLAEWTDAAYKAKMDRWEGVINEYVRRVRK